MRVLVFGSRTYGREKLPGGTYGEELPHLGLVFSVLQGLYEHQSMGYLLTHMEHFYVRHGYARGADSHAHSWARAVGPHPGDRRTTDPDVCSVVEEPFPADWSRGKRAGFERNARMLHAEGRIDCGLGFVDKPLAESKGSAMMARLLREAKIPVHVMEKMGD